MKKTKNSEHNVDVKHEPAPKGQDSGQREVIRINKSPKKQDNQKKGPAIAALAGTLVGATAGVLLAPKSGKALRNDISDGVTKAKDKSVEVSGNVKDKSASFAQSVKTKSNDFVGKVKNLKKNKESKSNQEEALAPSGYSKRKASELDETEVPVSTMVNHDVEKMIVETSGAETMDDVIQRDVERTLEKDPDSPETLDDAAKLELERTYRK
ncbi:YtxH domain-containing protein [Guptibacillus algicola]|uniref:YtxH domain-containing protein n=1 Tax=Guptibacillus algicola TaxID=225844 RepID=UPI001CD2973E|nr:YtxH domain-containing protein [Alkalihalobacillus algicola]MCA0986484.1 YtxH domain-containing protein [Alkalihalobacillus algicola]